MRVEPAPPTLEVVVTLGRVTMPIGTVELVALDDLPVLHPPRASATVVQTATANRTLDMQTDYPRWPSPCCHESHGKNRCLA